MSYENLDRSDMEAWIDDLKEELVEMKKLLRYVVETVPSQFWQENKFRAETLSKISKMLEDTK